jgi:hypothetical protein
MSPTAATKSRPRVTSAAKAGAEITANVPPTPATTATRPTRPPMPPSPPRLRPREPSRL